MTAATYAVRGMTCGHCVNAVFGVGLGIGAAVGPFDQDAPPSQVEHTR